MERSDVSVQLPSFWSVMCSLGLYQDNQGSSGSSEEHGHKTDNLHRRHADHGRDGVSPKEHLAAIVFLLENLGFVINYEKSQLEPCQSLDFLGFELNSVLMELRLPGGKIKGIQTDTKKILITQAVSALELSRLLGKLNSTTQAIPAAPLFYRNLQDALKKTLEHSQQNYSAAVSLSPEAREELQWWVDHFTNWNGRSLISRKVQLTLETDASLTGWGATCEGTRTGGPWSREEQHLHINCLELLAAILAVKCFAKSKRSIKILLRMDNTSAIAYINKLGGTVSHVLNNLTKQLWLWCMERDISLQAQHLPGVMNTIADSESRVMVDRTDWMIHPQIFQEVNRKWGPLEVDLFASRLTTQIRRYISWRPDPEAIAQDAFTVDWAEWKGYANPPWNLIGKVLAQARHQRARLILITPVWKSQVWYPTLLEMLIDNPVLIPWRENLIQPTHPAAVPDITPQLAAWAISGSATESASFCQKLQNSSFHHGDKNHQRVMIHSLENGCAGVTKGVQIQFQDL